jgi:hypothetical protein
MSPSGDKWAISPRRATNVMAPVIFPWSMYRVERCSSILRSAALESPRSSGAVIEVMIDP